MTHNPDDKHLTLEDYARDVLRPTVALFANKFVHRLLEDPGYPAPPPRSRWQRFLDWEPIDRIRGAWAVLTGRKIATDDF